MLSGKKGSPRFLTEDVIYVVLGFLAVVVVVVFAINTFKDSDVDKLEKCRVSLKVKNVVEDVKGFWKYVSSTPDLCSTIDKGELPKKGNSKDDLENEVMKLIADAWKVSLEGQPSVFGNQIITNKKCFKVFIFEVKVLDDLKEGEVLKWSDFKNDLGLFPYKEFDVNGERVMYTVLDYVQDSPNPESEAGRIDVFPARNRDNFCEDDAGKPLDKDKCDDKRDNQGFQPKGIYAIAVVSGQGAALKGLAPPDSKINYIIIDTEPNIRGLCVEGT
ncbi:MAG: hypothetical protein ABIJ21_05735 [Nanoarchaeota archaeon]